MTAGTPPFDPAVAKIADRLHAAVDDETHDCGAWKTDWEHPDESRCSVCWVRESGQFPTRVAPRVARWVRAYQRAWGHAATSADDYYDGCDAARRAASSYAADRVRTRGHNV